MTKYCWKHRKSVTYHPLSITSCCHSQQERPPSFLKGSLSNLCCIPGWPALWLGRWSHLWSPDWLAAAAERAVGGRKPKSSQIPWERRPAAPDPDRQTKPRVKPSENHRLCTNPKSKKWGRACVLTCIMRGIACICIGVGELSPASLRFWRTRGLRRYSDSSSSNVHTGSGMSQPCTFMRFWARIRLT